ncbi:MAG: hypothetical protein R3E96_15035 [Planctomycetota bacterium]
MVAKGYGPEGALPPGADEVPEAAPTQFESVPLTFEMIADPYAWQRPNYFNDEHYQQWNSVYAGVVGSETLQVLRYEPLWKRTGKDIRFIRDGSSKFYIDINGDHARDEGDVDVPIKGKLTPIRVDLDIEGVKHSMGFYIETGQEQDQYQGLQSNLSGNDNNFGIYTTPGGSMVGTVAGEPIRIIDEDCDGVYGGAVAPFLHVGLTKGVTHPEFDSMIVGKGSVAQPFSRLSKLAGQWYELKPSADGASLEVGKVTPTVGSVKLKFKGPKPNWLILQGTGNNADVLFDIAQSAEVEVPAGEYKLLAGMIAKGKKRQLQTVLILPGADTPTYTVQGGEATEINLGGPFGFDCLLDVDPKGCVVLGNSVVVTGVAGERYERPWLCVPSPEVSVRLPGTKKGSKPEKMLPVSDTMSVPDKGWGITYFPQDLAVDLKGVSDKVEVKLSQKKHPLFGKIESDWLERGH